MELNEIKKIDLASYFINKCGYVLDRRKSTKRFIVLKSPHSQKLFIFKNRQTGHWLYKHDLTDSAEKAKTLIDYYIESGKSIKEIKQMFSHIPPPPSKNIPNPQPAMKEEPHRKKNVTIFPVEATTELSNPSIWTRRGLKYETIAPLYVTGNQDMALLYLVSISNGRMTTALRFFVNKNGKVVQRFLSHRLDGAYFCGDFVNYLEQESKKLYIFESAIDLFSYIQLHPDQSPTHAPWNLFIATCGNPASSFWQGLSCYINHRRVEHITLCFDGDKAGERFCELVKKAVAHCTSLVGLRRHAPPPPFKDWNDVIMNKPTNP